MKGLLLNSMGPGKSVFTRGNVGCYLSGCSTGLAIHDHGAEQVKFSLEFVWMPEQGPD